MKKIIKAPRWVGWLTRISFLMFCAWVLYWTYWSEAAEKYELREKILATVDEYLITSNEWSGTYYDCETAALWPKLFLEERMVDFKIALYESWGKGADQGPEILLLQIAAESDYMQAQREYQAILTWTYRPQITYFWLVRFSVENWIAENEFFKLEKDLQAHLRRLKQGLGNLVIRLSYLKGRKIAIEKKYANQYVLKKPGAEK